MKKIAFLMLITALMLSMILATSCQDEIVTQKMGYGLTVNPVGASANMNTMEYSIRVQLIAGEKDARIVGFENGTTEWHNWITIESSDGIDPLSVVGKIIPVSGDIIDITEPGSVTMLLIPSGKTGILDFKIVIPGEPTPGSWVKVGLKSLLYQEGNESRIKRINLWDIGAFQAPRITY